MTRKNKADSEAESGLRSVEDADADAGDENPSDSLDVDAGDDLAAARREAAEHRDQYLRTVAELQNIQRRHERDRAELSKYAAEALIRDLLPTLDDLDRAIGHAGASGAAQGEGLVAGVELVHKGLVAVLEKHGVKRIPTPIGQPFDPAHHEAVGMAEDPDAPPNSVIAEHRAGYLIGDRLLRPAMVLVAMPKAAATDS